MSFLAVVSFTAFIAVLGYVITPDSTPYANEQFLEFTAQKPGFRASILNVHKNEHTPRVHFFRRMFFGQRNPYTPIPFDSYHYDEDYIVLKVIIDEDKDIIVPRRFRMADVVYPLSITDSRYDFDGGYVSFVDIDEQAHSIELSDLKKKVENYHLTTKRFLLGTDRFGRDVLSQLIIGARVSLSVGFIAVFISLLIGITLGAVSGYFKGWVDTVIVWLINVVWSIPTLLLVIAITFALGKGFWQIFVAVGLTMWVEVARVVRGQVLSVREKEYVEATKALGYGSFRIIFRHILPNVISPVIVISAANFASAILIEAGLSFLGIGVQPPMPSWGTMIKEHYSYIILDKAYLAILPGLAIMSMVMAFMIIGNGLRDALDVKTVSLGK